MVGVLISRMWRAIKLQSALYEEVEADKSANVQAGLVIVIVAIATAIGSGLSSLTSGGLLAAVWSLLLALVGWLLWALIVYVIGAKIMKGKGGGSTDNRCRDFARHLPDTGVHPRCRLDHLDCRVDLDTDCGHHRRPRCPGLLDRTCHHHGRHRLVGLHGLDVRPRHAGYRHCTSAGLDLIQY